MRKIISILALLLCYTNIIPQASADTTQKQSEYYLNLANASMEIKQYEIATDYYSKVLILNPENPIAYAKRGVARYLNGDCEGAVSDYTKAETLNSITIAQLPMRI